MLASAPAARARVIVCALIAVAAFAWVKPVFAYAWMIRHDYTACAQCHADPSGGGLLTPYGRAQGELILRMPYGPPLEDPGKASEFLFGAFTPPDDLLLGGDARGLAMDQMTEGSPPVHDAFLMQADLTGQIAVDRFRTNASIGFAQRGALKAALTSAPENNLVSRVHWIGLDLGAEKNWLLRAGRMNLPFGVRSIEHPLWVRETTRTDINDGQQHGLALAYSGEACRGEVMAIAGNFQVSPSDYRERGASAYVEWDPATSLAVGASGLVTYAKRDLDLQTPAIRHAYGPFARVVPFPMLVILAETDVLVQSQPHTLILGAQQRVGYAALAQADFEVVQGLHVQATGETQDVQLSRDRASFGAWGTVHWFFAPHADIRGDVVYRSNASGDASTRSVTWLAQLHVYL